MVYILNLKDPAFFCLYQVSNWVSYGESVTYMNDEANLEEAAAVSFLRVAWVWLVTFVDLQVLSVIFSYNNVLKRPRERP